MLGKYNGVDGSKEETMCKLFGGSIQETQKILDKWPAKHNLV